MGVCNGNSNLDGVRVDTGEWYRVRVLPLYPLLTVLPRNTALTVIWIHAAVGFEVEVDERMLTGSPLSIIH